MQFKNIKKDNEIIRNSSTNKVKKNILNDLLYQLIFFLNSFSTVQ